MNADYLARAAVIGDSTRLADFAGGTFLPSAIPAAGQPFFGTGPRAMLQATGSAVRINGYSPSSADFVASAHAELMLENASFSAADSVGQPNLAVRQLMGRLNRLTIGVMDSAFSDPSATPETLDLAGPNARVTVYDAGVGDGQGRLSYDFFSPDPYGFKVIASLEQAIPEIAPPGDEQTFAHYPDLVCSTQYVDGDFFDGVFVERWHLQFATVVRDLGLESPIADERNVTGWGTALSGAYRFPLNPGLASLDRVMFSVTYGEGISHYIADLNAAPDTGDAVLASGVGLRHLPVLASYGGGIL